MPCCLPTCPCCLPLSLYHLLAQHLKIPHANMHGEFCSICTCQMAQNVGCSSKYYGVICILLVGFWGFHPYMCWFSLWKRFGGLFLLFYGMVKKEEGGRQMYGLYRCTNWRCIFCLVSFVFTCFCFLIWWRGDVVCSVLLDLFHYGRTFGKLPLCLMGMGGLPWSHP